MDKAFVEQMKRKLEKELADRETSVVAFWKEEVDKIVHKNSESLSALQQDLKNLLTRMKNRLETIRRSSEF